MISELEVSPSGRQLAIVSLSPKDEFDENSEPASFLWIMDVDGRKARMVPEPVGMVTSVSFVPSTPSVLYALQMPNETTRFKKYDPATGEISHVTVATHWHVESLHSASDGGRFAYVDYENDTLMLVDPKVEGSRVIVEGLNPYHWCWSSDGNSVFYISKAGRSVFRKEVDDPHQVTELFVAQESSEVSHIVASPDGTSLGVAAGGVFYSIDLATLAATKRFAADHYFAGYSWNATGVCYIDKVGEEREKESNLMVYDFGENRTKRVATGRLSYPRWISRDEVVVRRGNNEVWRFQVETLEEEKLFP